MDPNPLATGCPGLMRLTESELAILVAYRKLKCEARKSRTVGTLDMTHQASADTDEDVNREGDV